jgi:hypothetical protein
MRCDPMASASKEAACKPRESNAPGRSGQPTVQAASLALRSTLDLLMGGAPRASSASATRRARSTVDR